MSNRTPHSPIPVQMTSNNNGHAAAAAAIAASNTASNNYMSNTNISNIPQYSNNNLNLNNNSSNINNSNTNHQYHSQSSSQQQNQPSNSSNQVVGLHYKIGSKIGEGSFGVIFEGTNLINGIPVAIKFEPRKTDAPQLKDEYKTYKLLNGVESIPNAYYFGQEGLHNILVIDLLGPSLEDLFDWCGRKFSVRTVVQIAVQMITLIQKVHENDLIYRDIKPDNFLIGRQGLPDENSIHLVDFGMAKYYRDPKTKHHIPYREKKSLSGTARYMSVNTHLGREQSRRDDLEALGHVFFYFLKGQLPWQGLKAPTNKQKYEKIGEKKRTTPINELCNGLPIQFGRYLENVRNLQFDAEPDYDKYRQLLLSVLPDIGETADGHYDWMDLNNGKGWDLSINKKPNLHGYGHPNPPGEKRQHQKRSKQQQHNNNNNMNNNNMNNNNMNNNNLNNNNLNNTNNNIPPVNQQISNSQPQQLQQSNGVSNIAGQSGIPQYRSNLDLINNNNNNNNINNNNINNNNISDSQFNKESSNVKPLPNLPSHSYSKQNNDNVHDQAKNKNDDNENDQGCFAKLMCC